jgi:uncharacterized membrane-anchored protein
MRVKFIILVCLQALLLCGIIAYREYWVAAGDKVVFRTAAVDPSDIFRGGYVNLTYEISNLNLDSRSQKPDFLPGQPIYINLETDADGMSFAASVNKGRPEGGRFIQGRVLSEFDEAQYLLMFRDDSGLKREFTQSWLLGLKKGDKIAVCLDAQAVILSYSKDDAPYKQPCQKDIPSVHGVIENITETSSRKVNVEYGIESYFVEEGKRIELEQGRNARGRMKVEVALRKDGRGIISQLLPEKE